MLASVESETQVVMPLPGPEASGDELFRMISYPSFDRSDPVLEPAPGLDQNTKVSWR